MSLETNGKKFITFGAALAMTMSWSLHKSIFLAVVHGMLSWLYVLAWIVTRGPVQP
jgi:hypothetical protein